MELASTMEHSSVMNDNTDTHNLNNIDHSNQNNWILLDQSNDMKGTIVVDESSGNIICVSTRSCPDKDRWKTTVMPSFKQTNDGNRISDNGTYDFRTTHTLDLHKSRYLIELNPTLGIQLPNLRRLTLTRCDRLQRLPESICSLQFLEVLDLTDSPMIEALPENIGNLKCLKRLIFGGASGYHNKVLVSLPESLGMMENLEEMFLDKCKSLKSIPSSIGQLSKLSHLSMQECKSITKLPDTIGLCSNLVELSLMKCLNLVQVPDSICDLKNLEDLNLAKCSSLQTLPDRIGYLQSLVTLSLRDCKNLQLLPESVSRLTNLFRLDCKDCKSLKLIPTSLMDELSNLAEFEVSGGGESSNSKCVA